MADARVVPRAGVRVDEFARVCRDASRAVERLLRLTRTRPRQRCVACLRSFTGPWQLRKHRRTAHGLSAS